MMERNPWKEQVVDEGMEVEQGVDERPEQPEHRLPPRFVWAMCRARWPGRDAESYHRKVKKLTDDECHAIARVVWGEDEQPQVVRTALHQAVNDVLFAERRDVAELTIRDREFLLTGGMAEPGWSPTEAYDMVRLLEVSRITLVRDEEAGRYKRKAAPAEGQEYTAAAEGLAEAIAPDALKNLRDRLAQR